jgi:spore germination protein KC
MLGLTGCWNRRELSDLAIVMSIGVDKAPKKNEYRVSFQIVNPSGVAAGISGGGGKAAPVNIVTGTGTTLFEAIRMTSQKVPRQMFFAHIRLLVIGETLAKEGISELFDIFERSHEARMTSDVLIARGTTAESVISVITPLEKIPANSTVGQLKFTSTVWSENIKVEIDDLIRALVSDGSNPVISGIRLIGNLQKGMSTSNIEQTKPSTINQISGIAIFKRGKLARWLDNDDARGFMWAKNKMKSTIVRVDCKDKKESLGIEVTGSETKVKTEMKKGKPVIHLHIREEGNVAEMKCAADLSKPEELKKLEKDWSDETKKEVMAAVKIAQKEKSDIFGFGEAVSREHPKAWEKLKKEWNDTFSEVHVDVKVDAYIRRPGMRMKPYMLEKQKKEE